jgi:hypothetical protein
VFFETVTDTNMKQHETNKDTYNIYLEMFINCIRDAPLVNRNTSTPYSNSSYVRRNYDLSTLATPCEIRCRRDCGFGGWYTWSFTYSHRQESHGVRSGDLGGPMDGPCSSYPCLLRLRRHFLLIVIGAPLAADMLITVENENLNEFPCCFNLFHVVFVTVSKLH